MLLEAHCHHFDLDEVFPQNEKERRHLGVLAAASACDIKEFAHNEELARKAKAENEAALLPCFACHPQLPAVKIAKDEPFGEIELNSTLADLQDLAKADRLSAHRAVVFHTWPGTLDEGQALLRRGAQKFFHSGGFAADY